MGTGNAFSPGRVLVPQEIRQEGIPAFRSKRFIGTAGSIGPHVLGQDTNVLDFVIIGNPYPGRL
jgi:hypothetical protein